MKNNKDSLKYFLICCSKFSVPVLFMLFILIGSYIVTDPFKVIYSDNYSSHYVVPNRDYISTESFIKNYPKYKYNSFIFGSSRTMAFLPEEWVKYLPENARPFCFDASGESVYGIYRKLRYLDSLNISIENALIVLCRSHSYRNTKNHVGHLYIKHPATSSESWYDFHHTFFMAYLDPKFLLSFYLYNITNNYLSFMDVYIETRNITYDPISNKITVVDIEEKFKKSPEEYYKERNNIFYQRPEKERIDSVLRINSSHLYMLKEIKNILEKRNTNYKIILSPLYEQIKYHPEDKKILEILFGENLYDFTGKNLFTDDIRNYYEAVHFRTHIGDSIFKEIYMQKALE